MGAAYDPEEVRAIYASRLYAYGPNHNAQGWVSTATQEARFAALAAVGDLEGASVLDVGCGIADFYAYLTRRGIAARYAGMDFTPAMLATARRRFPHLAFYERDIHRTSVEEAERADYVVASGLFSHMDQALLHQALPTLFALCRRGLAFNVLSTLAPRPHAAGLFHADPLATFTHCRTLTPWVTLRHDYLPNDFTICLYREPVSGALVI